MDELRAALFLASEDVARCLSMGAAIDAMRTAFGALANGSASMPQRAATAISEHGATHLSMPCRIPGSLVLKSVTIHPKNPKLGIPTTQGILLLHDDESGRLLALMDAELLTLIRTGAASALATDLLARESAATLALFGAGPVAWWQLAGVAEVRRLSHVTVVERDPERAGTMVRRIAGELGIEAEVGGSDRVGEADIVCAATSSESPVFDGSLLSEGAHVNGVGSFRPEMRELDAATLRRGRVFVDHVPAARAGAGELIAAVAEGSLAWEALAGSLGELVLGRVVGRTHERQITVFKSVGVAVQDAACARAVYDEAGRLGLGAPIG